MITKATPYGLRDLLFNLIALTNRVFKVTLLVEDDFMLLKQGTTVTKPPLSVSAAQFYDRTSTYLGVGLLNLGLSKAKLPAFKIRFANF
jgi:hypothetical protein